MTALEYLRALRSGALVDADGSVYEAIDGIAVPGDVEPVLARRFVLGEELMREVHRSYVPPEHVMHGVGAAPPSPGRVTH